jgi:two-component system OmpR family sensor kinase
VSGILSHWDARMITQRTVAGRLAVEVGLVVAAVAAVGLPAGAVSALLLVDRFQAHYVLALLAAGLGTAAVGLGYTAGRIAGNRRAAWLIPALALYSVVVVPSTAMPPGHPGEASTPHSGLLIACLTVAAMLLAAIRPPARAGTRAGWLAATLGALLTLGLKEVSRAFPAVVPALTSPAAFNLVVLFGWCTVSIAVVVAGYRAGSPPLWRVGLGFGVIAAAHIYHAVRPGSTVEPSLIFAALRLLGIVVVLLGMAQLLRRALNAVLTERFGHQEELRLAGIRIEQYARTATEREHELRNGLSVLSGVAHLLGEGAGTVQDRRARSAVVAELRRLPDLLDRPAPRLPAPGLYCASELVEEFVAMWRVSGMDIEASVTPGLMAVGRSSVLAQVLTNVLTNCARHAPGATVRIVANQVGGGVVVEVRDDGPGIDASDDVHSAGDAIGLRLSSRLLRGEGGELLVHPSDPRCPGCTVSITVVAGSSPPVLARPAPEWLLASRPPVKLGQLR